MLNTSPDQEHLVGEAQSTFTAVLENSNLSTKLVSGWGGATLRDFNDPAGWLGLWMFHSELRSMSLTGKRLWSVAYQATDQAAEGVAPVDFEETTMPVEISSSYLKIPVATDRDVPASLRYLIARAGLMASLKSVDNQYQSNPIRVPGQQPLKNEQFLPFPDRADCLGIMLSHYTLDAHLQLEVVRAKRMQDAVMEMAR